MKNDEDNVVLFAGEPGRGKSTIMFQLARALDPERFGVDHTHFTIPDFLADSRESPRGSVVAGDEFLMHRRKHATKESIELVDFLQVCRGLNLHLFICFPHAGMLDRAVLDHRVRYRVDIPERGLAIMSERVYRTIHNPKGEEDYSVQWRELFRFKFVANSGALWDAYHLKKIEAARKRNEQASSGRDSEKDRIDREHEAAWEKRKRERAYGQTPTLLVRALMRKGYSEQEAIAALSERTPQAGLGLRTHKPDRLS